MKTKVGIRGKREREIRRDFNREERDFKREFRRGKRREMGDKHVITKIGIL
jgi:hypothetical protein